MQNTFFAEIITSNLLYRHVDFISYYNVSFALYCYYVLGEEASSACVRVDTRVWLRTSHKRTSQKQAGGEPSPSDGPDEPSQNRPSPARDTPHTDEFESFEPEPSRSRYPGSYLYRPIWRETQSEAVLELLTSEKFWLVSHVHSTPPLLSARDIIYSDKVTRTVNENITLWCSSWSPDNHLNVDWKNVIMSLVNTITTSQSRFQSM